MGRYKSLDPAIKTGITFPKSVMTTVRRTATAQKLTLSAFLLKLVREYYQSMARDMNGK